MKTAGCTLGTLASGCLMGCSRSLTGRRRYLRPQRYVSVGSFKAATALTLSKRMAEHVVHAEHLIQCISCSPLKSIRYMHLCHLYVHTYVCAASAA